MNRFLFCCPFNRLVDIWQWVIVWYSSRFLRHSHQKWCITEIDKYSCQHYYLKRRLFHWKYLIMKIFENLSVNGLRTFIASSSSETNFYHVLYFSFSFIHYPATQKDTLSPVNPSQAPLHRTVICYALLYTKFNSIKLDYHSIHTRAERKKIVLNRAKIF